MAVGNNSNGHFIDFSGGQPIQKSLFLKIDF